MAEILTEQIDALKREKPPNQGDKDLRQKLPKGVVLDRDGKPYVQSQKHRCVSHLSTSLLFMTQG